MWLGASVVGLVMATLAFWLSRTVADPDLWGHVKFGGDIWTMRRIAQRDPYSYLTGAQPWVNHEWLSELIFYLVFAGFGSAGLVILKTLLGLVTVGLVYRHLCRQGLTALRAGIVLMLAAYALPVGLATVRPQLFTHLLFTVLLLMLQAAERGRSRWLLGAPLLFALWVNLHGGFLAGAAVLLLWAAARAGASIWHAGRLAGGLDRENAVAAGSLVASGLATLLNPYGVGLLYLLARPATVVRPEIVEWQPVRLMSLTGIAYPGLLTLAGAGLLFSRRPRRAGSVAILLAVAILPLTALRHLPLFALAVPVLTGSHIADAWDRWTGGRGGDTPSGVWTRRALAGLFLVAALTMAGLSVANTRCVALDPKPIGGYPTQAVALLRDSGVRGNLAVFFNWGEYAIWHLAPGIKVSVDGRRETVYSEAVLRRNLELLWGAGAWDALLTEDPTDLVLVPIGAPAFNLLKLSRGWVLVHEDPLSGLFARAGSPLVTRLQGMPRPRLPHDGAGLCFP